MKDNKSEKHNDGITLVAVVVTIIVLLILAGVSLNLVSGSNGIIEKTEKAISATNEAAILEEVQLALTEGHMEYYLSDRNQTLTEFLTEKFSSYQTGSGATLTFNSNGDITYTKGNETIKLKKDEKGNVTFVN